MKVPTTQINKIEIPDKIVEDALIPNGARPAARAHQFTINGVTWDFVKQYHFAAVPEPVGKRRQDMLAGLMMVRPGDLMFFFDSDPHFFRDKDSRRGLRGIFKIASFPFLGVDSFTHPDPRYGGYRLLGSCPHCGCTQSSLPRRDRDSNIYLSVCANPDCPVGQRQGIPLGDTAYPEIVLPWRLELDPILIFNSPVSDERAYSDMEDPGILWVGRHDNQSSGTGRPGKGSSIRQLTPEEAIKLTRLLRTEPWQSVAQITKVPYNGSRSNIPTTFEIYRPSIRLGYIVKNEFDLCVALAQQFDDPTSSLLTSLNLVGELTSLEYASVLYPWGYTAGQTDFLMAFAEGKSRYKIIVIETKTGKVSDHADQDGAFLQVSMYIPWVIQRLIRDVLVAPDELEVIPVVIGKSIYQSRDRLYSVGKPKEYRDRYHFPDGKKIDTVVRSPIFLSYQVVNPHANSNGIMVANYIEFLNQTDRLTFLINWKPDHGISTDYVMRLWIRNGPWEEARQNSLSQTN